MVIPHFARVSAFAALAVFGVCINITAHAAAPMAKTMAPGFYRLSQDRTHPLHYDAQGVHPPQPALWG